MPLPGGMLGVHKGVRQALRERDMDYWIAGAAGAALFLYLIFALLRPERF